MKQKNSVTTPVANDAWVALLKRLHFYIGMFVGPFMLIAALSGVLYALTPQLEDWLYRSELHTPSQGPALPLALQVEAAQHFMASDLPVAAVRPAAQIGDTTRIMFAAAGMDESTHRAIFIDPVTGTVRGDLTVYGSGGVLPLRMWLDQLHRSLLLGDVGRLYSELAASWLWVAALGGVLLWAKRPKLKGRRSLRALHASTGLWLLVGLLFFSATGLTWSQYAGDRIGELRAHYGWSTPGIATALKSTPAMPSMPMGEHAEHHLSPASELPDAPMDAALFDSVLATARAAGIAANKIEIRPARKADRAWVVSEIDRRWPTQVDAVAIDAQQLKVVDHVTFASYSLPAKLTRWGIDAHMGVLFGLANQLVLVVFASGLGLMVIWGYLLWWRRRPLRIAQPSLLATWLTLGRGGQCLAIIGALFFGFCLPVLGWSLLGFIAWDVALQWRRKTPALPAHS